jgi:hypothetical protein
VLLRNGISYGVFAEWTRKVFVNVAYDDFAPEGRKQTVPRTAKLTGMTREEVKRLVELQDVGDAGIHKRFNRAIRVISGWTNDRRFVGANKKPRTLPLEGKNSFTELVSDYNGNMLAPAMLALLEAAGTVKCSGNKVKLIKRAYVPAGDSIETIRILGADAAELIRTIDHNLVAEDPQDLRFQRKVAYTKVTTPATLKFKGLASRKAQALLEELNTWLVRHADDKADDQDQRKKVSLGIYYFEDDSTENDA